MGAANSCTVQTADLNCFWLLSLGLYSVPGFPLQEETDLRRATAHQLWCSHAAGKLLMAGMVVAGSGRVTSLQTRNRILGNTQKTGAGVAVK